MSFLDEILSGAGLAPPRDGSGGGDALFSALSPAELMLPPPPPTAQPQPESHAVAAAQLLVPYLQARPGEESPALPRLPRLFLAPLPRPPPADAQASAYLALAVELVDALLELCWRSPAAPELHAALLQRLGSAQLAPETAQRVYLDGGAAADERLCELAVQRQPAAVARLLRPELELWRHFWADASVCSTWFDGGWNKAGEGLHVRGSRALARFALSRRHTVWDLLVWSDRPVSPATAALRPASLAELDGAASAAALGRTLGDIWWACEELWETLAGGEALYLQPHTFRDALRGARGARELLARTVTQCTRDNRPLLAQTVLDRLSPLALLRALPLFGPPFEQRFDSMAGARCLAALQRPAGGAEALAELCAQLPRAEAALRAARAAAEAAGEEARHYMVLAAARQPGVRPRLLLLAHAWLLRLRVGELPPASMEPLMAMEGVAFRRSACSGRKQARDRPPAWRYELDGYASEMGQRALGSALCEAAVEAWQAEVALRGAGATALTQLRT